LPNWQVSLPCLQGALPTTLGFCLEPVLAQRLHWFRDVKRLWTTLLVSALSLSGVAVAADALVVTQREELDGFLDAVSREDADLRVDGALSYADTDLVPLRLSAEGKVQRFESDERGPLNESLRQVMGVFDGKRQRLLQHSVRVEGDHASVTTRVGDAGYEQTVIYELVRKGERWLIRGIRAL
jgi:hypothetical protein